MQGCHAKEKIILWDHSSVGQPEICHPTVKRNVSVIVKDRIVGLAARTLEGEENNKCIFVGSVNTDKNSVGLVIAIDQYEEHQRRGLLLPGDIEVPVLFGKKTKAHEEKTVAAYISDLKSLVKKCGDRFDVDLSNVVAVNLQCNVEGPSCTLHVEAIIPTTTFKVVPIHPVPAAVTALYSSLTNNSRSVLFKSGLLTMDPSKKIVYLLENDPRASTTQLVGIWVSGVDVVRHPYVWAACLRYLTCSAFVFRLCLPPKPFLLSVCSSALQPQYYDCFTLKEANFSLLTGCCNLTVTKIPSFSSHITVTDLTLETKSKNFHSFSEARNAVLAECNDKAGAPTPEVDIQSNVDDFPRTTPKAQQILNTDFKPSVPDLSLLSDSGCGNPKDVDDYRVLPRKLPLRTLDVNIEQFGPTHHLPKNNSLARNLERKASHRNPLNDENEPVPLAEAPRPFLSNTHLPSISNPFAHLAFPHSSPNIPVCNHVETPKRHPFSSTNVCAASENNIQNNDANAGNYLYNHNRLMSNRRKSFPATSESIQPSKNNNYHIRNIAVPSSGDCPEVQNYLTSENNVPHPTSAQYNPRLHSEGKNTSDKLILRSGDINCSPNHAHRCHNTVNNGGICSPTIVKQKFSENCKCISQNCNEKLEVLPLVVLQNDKNVNEAIDRDQVSDHLPSTIGDEREKYDQNHSFEIKKLIEEQDHKLRMLQDQIQKLFEVQTPPSHTEKEGREISLAESKDSDCGNNSEIYQMLKHQDQHLKRLQEQIDSVLQLHQLSLANKNDLQDSGLGASPSACQNVGVNTSFTGGVASCGELATNKISARYRSCGHTPDEDSKCCKSFTNSPGCQSSRNCRTGAIDGEDLSLHMSNLNVQTVIDPPPSLPPSVHVDMNDYVPSCVDLVHPNEGDSHSVNKVCRSDGGFGNRNCDISQSEQLCQQLLGNINYILGKPTTFENPAVTENERNELQSFLLPSITYQTLQLSHLDSDLTDLALKYLGQPPPKATQTTTKMYLEQKIVQNKEQKSEDTTSYGLSSSNVSYATKMYLERHGLASSGVTTTPVDPEEKSIWVFGEYRRDKSDVPFLQKGTFAVRDVESSNISQILDIQALKRKPKLL